jgi:hypothetical protein
VNERFQKLIEEAYIQPPEQVAEHIRYTPPKEFSLEKFAQLIVRECAVMCRWEHEAQIMLKHFGVEE